jgi:hypothetical protein
VRVHDDFTPSLTATLTDSANELVSEAALVMRSEKSSSVLRLLKCAEADSLSVEITGRKPRPNFVSGVRSLGA